MQRLDIRDNPKLVMPPKPKEQVKGSGAEWYNIDFDPEILKKGAVVATAKVIKGQWLSLKERREGGREERRNRFKVKEKMESRGEIRGNCTHKIFDLWHLYTS